VIFRSKVLLEYTRRVHRFVQLTTIERDQLDSLVLLFDKVEEVYSRHVSPSVRYDDLRPSRMVFVEICDTEGIVSSRLLL